MTIDEEIAEQRENAKTQREIAEECFEEHIFNKKERVEHHKYADEFEQLAEWLEELKAYRGIGTVEECRNSVLDIERTYNKGYADGSLSVTEEIRGKAIDDFCAEIKKEYDNDYCPNVSDYLDYKISLRDLFNIAEQLKAGN